jgi:hypothetical protein
MDERDDYGELAAPAPIGDPRRWYEVARNLAVVVGLVGFALMLAGLAVVKVTEIRHTPLPNGPRADLTEPAP